MFLTYSLRCALFLLGCVLFLVTGSCSKEDAVAPLPTEDMIQGQVTPARAASYVTLTGADGRDTYSLTAEPSSSYNAPALCSICMQFPAILTR
ncbi:hypothetical protein KBK19_09645 [Microvirga sp. STR05]|uniref:Uncharacterized protein n=1 Tax=Hymenobacter duratus TaxID=2771356 RepID=A0ABR8JEK8_9BACT|nr:hypothetical protein [Hymenobacter duratus]MBD2715298.1 hypothetical protein [Hymenobacter duratus]MBR7950205.1 hypothetical protein [Microvirga sp. STR05]